MDDELPKKVATTFPSIRLDPKTSHFVALKGGTAHVFRLFPLCTPEQLPGVCAKSPMRQSLRHGKLALQKTTSQALKLPNVCNNPWAFVKITIRIRMTFFGWRIYNNSLVFTCVYHCLPCLPNLPLAPGNNSCFLSEDPPSGCPLRNLDTGEVWVSDPLITGVGLFHSFPLLGFSMLSACPPWLCPPSWSCLSLVCRVCGLGLSPEFHGKKAICVTVWGLRWCNFSLEEKMEKEESWYCTNFLKNINLFLHFFWSHVCFKYL